MKLEFLSLPPLEKRILTHSSQMPDVINSGFYAMLNTPNNRYVAEVKGDEIALSWPFFSRKEDLPELVDSLLHKFSVVDLDDLPENTAIGMQNITSKHSVHSYTLFQKPLTASQYTKKISKFNRHSLNFRQLGEGDVGQMEDLVAYWYFTKANLIKNSQKDGDDILNELCLLSHSMIELNSFEDVMNSDINVYGAFVKDKLAAFTTTYGNDRFQAFKSRVGVRVNSFSPQEYLDYCVCFDLVSKGVQMFERGSTIKTEKTGLERYKEKFGTIYRAKTVALISAVPRNSSRLRLNNLDTSL